MARYELSAYVPNEEAYLFNRAEFRFTIINRDKAALYCARLASKFNQIFLPEHAGLGEVVKHEAMMICFDLILEAIHDATKDLTLDQYINYWGSRGTRRIGLLRIAIYKHRDFNVALQAAISNSIQSRLGLQGRKISDVEKVLRQLGILDSPSQHLYRVTRDVEVESAARLRTWRTAKDAVRAQPRTPEGAALRAEMLSMNLDDFVDCLACVDYRYNFLYDYATTRGIELPRYPGRTLSPTGQSALVYVLAKKLGYTELAEKYYRDLTTYQSRSGQIVTHKLHHTVKHYIDSALA